MIEFANHILAQAKEDMKLEKSVAIRTAIEKERADCVMKLDHELRVARQMVEEKDKEVEMYRMIEIALAEECKRYKSTIRRLTESENFKNMPVEAGLHKEHGEERLEMSQSNLEEVAKSVETDKDEVEVSESKKVRLEASDDASYLSRRLELLENDNKRLNAELQSLRESKESAETKIESLEADKVRLELELVKERSRRSFASDPTESREKEMNASVAMVSESGSSQDATNSPLPFRGFTCTTCLYSFSHMQKKIEQTAAKLAKEGRITVTTCNPGDIVLVCWNPAHGKYTLYQESSMLYFINSDCMGTLKLESHQDGTPKKIQIIAEVLDKQFCQARKVRFHLSFSFVYPR